jgi:hypothetical protein
MISLDPEFLGRLTPQSQFTEGTNQGTMSFARQPRLHRLHIQEKADETEDASEDVGQGKRKTRHNDKSVKRWVIHFQ